MKYLYIFCFVFPLFQYTYSQKAPSTTTFPFVENQHTSEYGKTSILSVTVTQDITLIMFEEIVPRHIDDAWVSLSSQTLLSYNGKVSRIKDWGIIYNGTNFESLDFNQKYTVKSDRRYIFYMAFDTIPRNIDRISVYEEGKKGFYWENIHLNTGNSPETPSLNNRSPSPAPAETFHIKAYGTCFAINADGYLVTNYHVIQDAQKIRIRGINKDFNHTHPANIITTDEKNDIALLKVENVTIDHIPYGISSDILNVGDDVFVLGYPLRTVMGDEIKLTNGLVSSRTGYKGDITSYQISATIQPGNSGGPLFDKNGNVIGIVNARLAVENAAYAIETPYLLALLSSENEIPITPSGSLNNLPLPKQVEQIRNFIYIVEVE